MPYREWWLRHGWRQLGVEDFAPVLILTAVWLLVAIHRRVFHPARVRKGRGVVTSIPIIAWALFALRQAVNATQLDLAGPYTRYPYYWSCILASGLVGIVVFTAIVTSDRLLATAGTRRISVGVLASGFAAVCVAVVVWIGVFVHEASLPAGVS
jgi:hypothetical protein